MEIKNKTLGKCEIVCFEGEHLAGFQAGDGEWEEYYINEIDMFIKNL